MRWSAGAGDVAGEKDGACQAMSTDLAAISSDQPDLRSCRFPLEMADNPRDSTLVGGGPGLRIPREMADSYTAL